MHFIICKTKKTEDLAADFTMQMLQPPRFNRINGNVHAKQTTINYIWCTITLSISPTKMCMYIFPFREIHLDQTFCLYHIGSIGLQNVRFVIYTGYYREYFKSEYSSHNFIRVKHTSTFKIVWKNIHRVTHNTFCSETRVPIHTLIERNTHHTITCSRQK